MFNLFKSHLDLAHNYWKKQIQKGDQVIDATCGNGQDTLRLCQLALGANEGMVYAFDIHPKAIALTEKHLQAHLSIDELKRVRIIQGCHSHFPESINSGSIKLVVYNLGYLPGGGDKSQTTKVETTLQSIERALSLLQPGGVISITCYPGHEEGEKEENQILKFASSLDQQSWSCFHHVRINRQKSPSLLLIQKITVNC